MRQAARPRSCSDGALWELQGIAQPPGRGPDPATELLTSARRWQLIRFLARERDLPPRAGAVGGSSPVQSSQVHVLGGWTCPPPCGSARTAVGGAFALRRHGPLTGLVHAAEDIPGPRRRHAAGLARPAVSSRLRQLRRGEQAPHGLVGVGEGRARGLTTLGR